MKDQLQELICGWPVDEDVRAMLRRIHPLPIVVPGSVQTHCARCQELVTIGPRQASMLLAQPTLTVMCVVCIAATQPTAMLDTLSLGNPDSKIEEP